MVDAKDSNQPVVCITGDGGFGMRVHHHGEIQGALDQAMASDKPAVVDVVSDITGIAPQAWTSS
jgi:thiamine pyrophosphate-dependent acetolactate synthase large subunit-like protein